MTKKYKKQKDNRPPLLKKILHNQNNGRMKDNACHCCCKELWVDEIVTIIRNGVNYPYYNECATNWIESR